MNRLIPLFLVFPTLAAAESAVTSPADPGKTAAFDILQAQVQADGDTVTFRMTTASDPGSNVPDPVGALAGAPVLSYVWPTTLDPATVGFQDGTGILALAATSHPDFDDTPLYDENGDGDKANDGVAWHSHWVVLIPNDACGVGSLAVRDIPEGETPKLPDTWPGLPVFIDSPSETPVFDGPTVTLTMTLPGADGAGYDGVTAALRVNASVHAPLLCVTEVFDVASGDLSLPGKID
jgi:hypothetical protein